MVFLSYNFILNYKVSLQEDQIKKEKTNRVISVKNIRRWEVVNIKTYALVN